MSVCTKVQDNQDQDMFHGLMVLPQFVFQNFPQATVRVVEFCDDDGINIIQ